MYKYQNCQSCVGLSIPFYTNPLQLQDARFLLMRIFIVPHIYGLNYAQLLIKPIRAHSTRRGTDLCHQYGIFGGISQTSFSRNATRAGSEEGQLYSQAVLYKAPGLPTITPGLPHLYQTSALASQSLILQEHNP